MPLGDFLRMDAAALDAFLVTHPEQVNTPAFRQRAEQIARDAERLRKLIVHLEREMPGYKPKSLAKASAILGRALMPQLPKKTSKKRAKSNVVTQGLVGQTILVHADAALWNMTPIDAVKYIRETHKCGFKEAKDIVNMLVQMNPGTVLSEGMKEYTK